MMGLGGRVMLTWGEGYRVSESRGLLSDLIERKGMNVPQEADGDGDIKRHCKC